MRRARLVALASIAAVAAVVLLTTVSASAGGFEWP
jgi:hypothetical protein